MSTSNKLDNAFDLEKKRDNFAKKYSIPSRNNYFNLYKDTEEIHSLNVGLFWDKTLQKRATNNVVNPIEQHRIKILCKEILDITRDKTINLLDIGMGNSLIEHNIQKYRNINIFGIDISHYAVRKAKQSIKGKFKSGSIIEIP